MTALPPGFDVNEAEQWLDLSADVETHTPAVSSLLEAQRREGSPDLLSAAGQVQLSCGGSAVGVSGAELRAALASSAVTHCST